MKDIHFEKQNEKLIDLFVKKACGSDKIEYLPNEVAVFCLVKNGEKYIGEFIKHYFNLGVKHIVFLDNGSADKTIEIAASYSGVTVIKTSLPFANGNNMRMRDYLIGRFAKNRWSLCVDIDEFFDFPFSNILRLEGLIGYLNNNNYTAVATQMLDMFPKSIARGGKKKFERCGHNYYSLDGLIKKDYYFENGRNEKTNIKVYFGGIRNVLFNLESLCLTKHALIFNDWKTKRGKFGHLLSEGKIADFSAVLFHYKFTDDFFSQVEDAVRQEQYYNNSAEYKKYLGGIMDRKVLRLKNKGSINFQGIAGLVGDNFLVISPKYKNYANRFGGLKLKGAIASKSFGKEDVAVIIGVKDRFDFRIENAFKSLKSQDYDQNLIKIILVDYGSKDGPSKEFNKLCDKYNAKYIKVDDAQAWNRSHALNIGIKRAKTKYVLCSDVDIVFEKNYISECVKEMQNDQFQMVYSEMNYSPEGVIFPETDIIKNFYDIRKKCKIIPWKHYKYKQGVTIIFTLRKYFFDVSGYDEAYCLWGWEDTDLIKRFELKGLKLKEICNKTSHFHQWHPLYDGVGKAPNFEEQVEKNKCYFFNKNTILRNFSGWGLCNIKPAGLVSRLQSLKKRIGAQKNNEDINNLAAVCCYFNPGRYKSRFENYKIFREGIDRTGVKLLTVELAFGDDDFELRNFSDVLQLRTAKDNIMWQKERLLNIGIQELISEGYKKIAWLDADIVFEDGSWVEELSRELDRYNVVQVFSEVYREEEKGNGGYAQGSVFHYKLSGRISTSSARPGFGWAARSEILKNNLLYDSGIASTENDTLIFYGNFFHDLHLRNTLKNYNCFENFSFSFSKHYNNWAVKWSGCVQGKIGYLNHKIRALYHGPIKNRGYGHAGILYKKYDFDPFTDIHIDLNGCWEWAGNKADFHKEVKEYFYSRKEDE